MPLFSELMTHYIDKCHVAVLIMLFLAASPALALADPRQLELGKRIYRDGVLPSGELLRARVRGDVPLSGAQAACARCHQRSALGASEGGKVVPPLRGIITSQAQTADHTTGVIRHTYSAETLARALRKGVDAAGRKLDALMPVYQLSQGEMNALYTYLSTLPTEPDPGVDERDIHFATVIAGAVSTAARQALLDVLQTYVKEKNGETRSETVRRSYAARTPEKMYRAHRTWVLHIWELHGPPAGWAAQLENYYRQQPVFTLLSGVGAGDWQPVHDFCERREVPCLLPNTDAPPRADTAFYTIYFSKGVALEAEVLAKHLRTAQPAPARGSVVQVYRDDDIGAHAARALREILAEEGETKLIDRVITAEGSPTEQFWAALAERERPSSLMLWLRAADLKNLHATARAADIFLSSSLIGDDLNRLPQALPAQVYLVHPFALAEAREQSLLRTRAWLRSRKIAAADERVLANSYFAVTIAGEALMHLRGNFVRDYFIERIEHALGNTLSSSIYPHVSLGPGQRYISKGAYVIKLQGDERVPVPVGEWIIP